MKKFIFILLAIISTNVYSQSIQNTINEQSKLIEQVKNDFLSINLIIENLKYENEQIHIENSDMKKLCQQSNEKILKLEENINLLKIALNSNKEDESVIIYELGLMVKELDRYKEYIYYLEKKQDKNTIWVNILIPLTSTPFIINGICNKDKNSIYGGIGLFLGLETIYQGGKFVFKLW